MKNGTLKQLIEPLLLSGLSANGFYGWTIQGFGMLRYRLTPDARLHIWDHSRAYPGVSMIHDHLQWAFTSHVVAGSVTNTRYEVGDGSEYWQCRLRAGVGGGLDGAPELVRLREVAHERCGPGESYHQSPIEPHLTVAAPGTVTIIEQERTSDTDGARVWWPKASRWGTAEPRHATREEVDHFCQLALQALRGEPLPAPAGRQPTEQKGG